MYGEQREGLLEEDHVAPLVNPAARTTRVRQGNDDARATFVRYDMLATDGVTPWSSGT